jgi:hypothetical protein
LLLSFVLFFAFFCPFSFVHCIFCSPSLNSFWLWLWHPQVFFSYVQFLLIIIVDISPPLHCILVLMGCNNYTKLIPSIFQFYFISSIRYSSSSFNHCKYKPSQISLTHL